VEDAPVEVFGMKNIYCGKNVAHCSGGGGCSVKINLNCKKRNL
jgi:hypothetical protein